MKEYLYRSIRNKTLIRDMFAYFMLKIGILDNGIIGKARVNIIYNKLKKEFNINKINKNFTFYKKKNIDYNNVIWVFWYQGIQEAPDIVKSCYKSILTTFKNKKVILITKKNLNEYIDVPNFILDRLKSNEMSITHFSDIIRASLLVTYGGLWIDATVYCTGKEDYDYFSKLDFFVYRDGWFDKQKINMANWLIWSKPHNILLETTLIYLYNYWYKKDYLCDYFIFHLFFKMSTEIYSDMWNKVPYINHIDNHLLINDIFKEFDLQRFEFIKRITCFHKLTYKLDFSKDKNNSYLNYIIRNSKGGKNEII